jgi:dolichol-phosphate mannosyltransferase
LIATILFCSGIILLVLGIVGIYIGKIFVEVKRRSLYITSEKINL